MDDKVRRELKDELSDIYSGCGPDLGWADRAPDEDEFVDVLRDLFASTRLHAVSPQARMAWQGLTVAEKHALCLEVGP